MTAVAGRAPVVTSMPLTVTTHTTRSRSNTVSTSTTTSTGTFGCVDVTACLADLNCSACLLALNTSSGFVHSNAEFNKLGKAAVGEYQVSFFHTLMSTA